MAKTYPRTILGVLLEDEPWRESEGNTITDPNYTVKTSDKLIVCSTTLTAVSLLLPPGNNKTHFIIFNNGEANNAVTITPSGTEQIYRGGAGTAFVLYDLEIIDIHFVPIIGHF